MSDPRPSLVRLTNQSKPREAIEKYAGATYIQHNPGVGDGKVVEHWDAVRPIPASSENRNGMF